jgi:hypothetical protein
LDYVPYDGYIAQLHQGERVLTANEASAYSSSVTGVNVIQAEQGGADFGSITVSPTYNIEGVEDADSVRKAVMDTTGSLREVIIETLEDLDIYRKRVAYK